MDDHAVQRVAEQAHVAQGAVGDGHTGDAVAVAVKRSAEGQRAGGADGRPLAGQSDVGGQLEVLTGIGGASRHLGLEVAQTCLTGDEVGILLRARAAGEAGERFVQGILGGRDDGLGADGGAADGVDLFVVQLLGQAVGAVVGLDGVQDVEGVCPAVGSFLLTGRLDIRNADAVVFGLGKRHGDSDVTFEAGRRPGVSAGDVGVVHRDGQGRRREKRQRHNGRHQGGEELVLPVLVFHGASFIV